MARQKKSESKKNEKTKKTQPSKKSKAYTTAKSSRKVTKKTQDWRVEIKVMLEQMKKDLLHDVAKSIKNESDYMKHDVGDFYDHASNDRDRELALMITDRERTKLVQIVDALKRIEDGEYGECENCQDEIGEDRLRAMPFAKFCLSCKIELERLGEI
jgi:DnaK suppressor protein